MRSVALYGVYKVWYKVRAALKLCFNHGLRARHVFTQLYEIVVAADNAADKCNDYNGNNDSYCKTLLFSWCYLLFRGRNISRQNRSDCFLPTP